MARVEGQDPDRRDDDQRAEEEAADDAPEAEELHPLARIARPGRDGEPVADEDGQHSDEQRRERDSAVDDARRDPPAVRPLAARRIRDHVARDELSGPRGPGTDGREPAEQHHASLRPVDHSSGERVVSRTTTASALTKCQYSAITSTPIAR